jgi:hypothetical protein
VAIWRDRQPATGPVVYTDDQADLRAAYNRGRMDERRSRRHHPIIALVVVVLALVGGWMVYLAAREGSFSSAGQVADQRISTVSQEAGPALRQTGDDLKDAGQALKEKSQTLRPGETDSSSTTTTTSSTTTTQPQR